MRRRSGCGGGRQPLADQLGNSLESRRRHYYVGGRTNETFSVVMPETIRGSDVKELLTATLLVKPQQIGFPKSILLRFLWLQHRQLPAFNGRLSYV